LVFPVLNYCELRPLDSWKTIINYSKTMTDKSGLTIDTECVKKQYQTGIKISKQQMDEIHLLPDKLYPQWNYDLYLSNAKMG